MDPERTDYPKNDLDFSGSHVIPLITRETSMSKKAESLRRFMYLLYLKVLSYFAELD